MREITDAQYNELAVHYRTLVEGCHDCRGSGLGAKGKCSCTTLYEWVRTLIIAGIPRHYWHYELADIKVNKDVLAETKKYIGLIGADRPEHGILYCGTSGTGKTTLMCIIGKAALIRGYRVNYIMANDINKLANRIKCGDAEPTDMDDLIDGEYVLLDELDKMTVTPSASTNILNTMKSNLSKTWIVATNYTDTQIEESFGTAMMSLLKRHTLILPVLGKDLSDGVQERMRVKPRPVSVSEDDLLMREAKDYEAATLKRLKDSYDEVL